MGWSFCWLRRTRVLISPLLCASNRVPLLDTLRFLAFPTTGRWFQEMLRCSRLRSPNASAFGSFDELRSHLARFFIKHKKHPWKGCFLHWRKRRDSNSRAREGKLISSQPRYDHFDTLPCSNFVIVSRVVDFVKNDNWLLPFSVLISSCGNPDGCHG